MILIIKITTSFYISPQKKHYNRIVKMQGSFRLAKKNKHLHQYFNFIEILLETVGRFVMSFMQA